MKIRNGVVKVWQRVKRRFGGHGQQRDGSLHCHWCGRVLPYWWTDWDGLP